MRGYDTVTNVLTAGSRVRLAMRTTGSDACRSSSFIGGGQTFKFSFNAPPRELLYGPVYQHGLPEIFIQHAFDLPELSSHIPCAAAET